MAAVYVPSSLGDLGATDANGQVLQRYLPLPGTPPEKIAGFVDRWKAIGLAGTLAPGAKVSTITGLNGGVSAQATAGNQPSFLPGGLNGRPAIWFNGITGTAQFLTCPTVAADRSEFTIAMVIQLTGTNNYNDICGLNGATNGNFLTLCTAKPIYYDSTGNARSPTQGWRLPNAIVATMVVDVANSLVRFGVNGFEAPTQGAISGNASSVLTGLSIGSRYNGNQNSPGQFVCSDWSLYNAALTPAQILALSRNLAAEYGIDAGIPATRNRVLIDGSSLFSGGHASTAGKSHFNKLKARLGPGWDFVNLCVGGATAASLYGTGAVNLVRVTNELSVHAEHNVVFWGEGSNSQDLANTWNVTNALNAAGAKVIACTTASRLGYMAAIDTLNAGIRAAYETNGCAGLADPANDYRIGLDGALQNAALNGTDDNLHQGDSGNQAFFEHMNAALLAYLRLPGQPIPILGSVRGANTITLRKLFVANNERGVIRLSGSSRRVGFSTTVTTGAASATQTVGSTAGWAVGDIVTFVTSGVSATISSITNATTLVLNASVTSATGETLAGYSASVQEGSYHQNYTWRYNVASNGAVTVVKGTNAAAWDGTMTSADVTCVQNTSGAAGVVFQFTGEAGKDLHFVGDVVIDASY